MSGPQLEPVPKMWVTSLRSIGFAVGWAVTGAISVAEIGLVSDQLQRYGNLITRYPSRMYKYTIGLYLATGILTLILALGSAHVNLFVLGFFTFAVMTMWISGAGVINHVSPFTAGNCGNTFNPPWSNFTSQCHKIVAIEALGWTLFSLTFLLTVAICVSKFVFHNKNTYGAVVDDHNEGEEKL